MTGRLRPLKERIKKVSRRRSGTGEGKQNPLNKSLPRSIYYYQNVERFKPGQNLLPELANVFQRNLARRKVLEPSYNRRADSLNRRLQRLPDLGVFKVIKALATHSHCRSRLTRRGVLFANRIAGKNMRRSPGRGGGYKRNQLSEFGC